MTSTNTTATTPALSMAADVTALVSRVRSSRAPTGRLAAPGGRRRREHVHPVCAGITSGPSHDDRARYARANLRLATLRGGHGEPPLHRGGVREQVEHRAVGVDRVGERL